jgi:hypothetical protein
MTRRPIDRSELAARMRRIITSESDNRMPEPVLVEVIDASTQQRHGMVQGRRGTQTIMIRPLGWVDLSDASPGEPLVVWAYPPNPDRPAEMYTMIGYGAGVNGNRVPTLIATGVVDQDGNPIAGPGTDHGALSGLADDDHTQYALLAGRAAGQTLSGGTAASEDLTLVSTAHATKGSIYFGAAGALAEITSAGQLVLPVTGVNGGLLIGGDANLYRSAANILKTDDSLHVATMLGAGIAPSYVLHVFDTLEATSGAGNFASFVQGKAGPASAPAASTVYNAIAGFANIASGDATDYSAANVQLRGIQFGADHAGSGTLTIATGARLYASLSSAGGLTLGQGVVAAIVNSGAGTMATGKAMVVSSGSNSGGGVITTLVGIEVDSQTAGGTTNIALRTSAGLVIFNETGDANTDVRIEGDTYANLFFTDASADKVGLNTASPATLLEMEETLTITGAVTDGYAAGLTLDPGYTAATAQTVTRHNYIDVQNVSLAGAGPAALTDACVLRFDAAAGTHKAVDSGTTKTTPGTVDAWMKVNINGTVYYMPCYTSKTT